MWPCDECVLAQFSAFECMPYCQTQHRKTPVPSVCSVISAQLAPSAGNCKRFDHFILDVGKSVTHHISGWADRQRKRPAAPGADGGYAGDNGTDIVSVWSLRFGVADDDEGDASGHEDHQCLAMLSHVLLNPIRVTLLLLTSTGEPSEHAFDLAPCPGSGGWVSGWEGHMCACLSRRSRDW